MRDLRIDELEHVYGGGSRSMNPPGKAKGHHKHHRGHGGKRGPKGPKGGSKHSNSKPSKSKSCK